jgi:23S rRNA pseudouridine955/2504/2580 synthase
MTSKLSTHIVAEDEAGLRLDRWFRRHFASVTHGQLQKLLRTGQVRVNGKRAEANNRLEAGQDIRVPPQAVHATPKKHAPGEVSRDARDLRKLIIYEDDDVFVLNKPPGLAVQGGTGLKENIDDMLLALSRGKKRPKLVHRLDRDTGGVLLVARSAFAAAKLSESFRDRATKKVYWAVTTGVPEMAAGKIDLPLMKKGEIMAPAGKKDEEAKSALTFYRTAEKAGKQAAFVVLWPVTGRTHQLRAHMKAIGAPLFGDRLYGGLEMAGLPLEELGSGLHLHARRLIIPHPREGMIDVTAPLHPEMRKTFRWFGFDENADADFTDTGRPA